MDIGLHLQGSKECPLSFVIPVAGKKLVVCGHKKRAHINSLQVRNKNSCVVKKYKEYEASAKKFVLFIVLFFYS